MASSMALRRLSVSPLLTKLVNRNHSSMVAPLFSRSFNSSSIPVTDSNEELCSINTHGGSMTRTFEFNVRHGTVDHLVEHPWQLEGPKGTYEAKKVEEGLFVRVDMPGIGKDEVKLWVDNDSVFIKGEGKKKSEYESSGRTYGGNIDLCSDYFNLKEIRAKMRNGVLRIVIPKRDTVKERNNNFEVRVE